MAVISRRFALRDVRTAFTCLLVALLACGRERERPLADNCPTWTGDVQALVADRCVACHASFASYLGLIATPVPPDDATHADLADARATLDTWAGSCRLAYSDNPIHAPGLMNPADSEFHGNLLREQNWDFALCQKCHGDDFGGGTSGKTCKGCHVEGPTSCGTCHEKTPSSGAHPAHTAQLGCQECHRVPARWDDPGHIVDDGPPAEVVLGPLAARDLDPPRRSQPPAYDASTGRCENVYCHGGGWGDARATHPTPVWTGQGQATCGSCHGTPPADHASTAACANCHGGAHLDGKVQLGDGSGTCSACHPAAPTSGAHQQHLTAFRLRGPIACSECHRVPTSVTSPGHIDSEPPVEITFGALASTGGKTPAWNGSSCTTTYCHGDWAPVWTRLDQGEAACGTCHGIPPAGTHAPTLTLRDCHGCHASSVDELGNILMNGGHLDGHVDL
jgi:predicted CxxxxCH...CXXCH cytochrome family protein